MSEFLELLLQLVLEVLCEGLDWCESWRFFVPLFSAIIIVGAISLTSLSTPFKLLSSIVALLVGVGTGMIWQASSGAVE